MAPGAFKTVYLLFALAALPQALAGPGCARRNYGKPDCVEKCKNGWGVAGHYMGNNKWGSVINDTDSTNLDNIIAVACGLNQTNTSDPGPTPSDLPGEPSSSPPPDNGGEPTSTPGEPSYPAPSDPPTSPSPSPSIPPPNEPSSPPPPPPSSSSSPPSSPPPPPATPSSAPDHTPSPSPSPSPTPSPSPSPSPTPSPSPSPSPLANSLSTGSSSTFENDALTGHNNARAQHGASPLTWSDDLANAASTWISGCVFEHSQGKVGSYGENLFAGSGDGYTITDAINDWMSEAKDYDPNNPTYSHFTQVVWKGTTQVGCAVHTCPAGTIFDASYGTAQFMACEYNPPGNVEGEFGDNVQA